MGPSAPACLIEAGETQFPAAAAAAGPDSLIIPLFGGCDDWQSVWPAGKTTMAKQKGEFCPHEEFIGVSQRKSALRHLIQLFFFSFFFTLLKVKYLEHHSKLQLQKVYIPL